MTVTTTAIYADYAANGVTVAFGLAAYCQTADQVEVLVGGVVQSPALYTVTGLRNPAGITATFAAAPTSGTVRVRRRLPVRQTVDTVNNETILQDVFDDALDRAAMVSQQLEENIGRAIQVAQGDTPITVPALAARTPGAALVFDAGGNIIASAGSVPTASVSSYVSTSVLLQPSRAALQKELAVVTFTPLSAQFGGVGDGVVDDLVALQACMDYCASIASAGAFRVQMDLGGRAWRVIAGALRGKAGVEIVNGQGLFSTVALSTSDYQPVYAWVIWEGTIAAANSANILETTVPGSQEAILDAAGGLVAGDQVMVTHTPPQTNLTAGINSSVTAIPVTSTAGWPNAGIIMIDSEKIAYVSKTATSVTARTTTGRGRLGSSAASHSNGARVSLWHSGWYWIAGNTARIAAEMNYVQEAPRALETGKLAVLLRHGHDFRYSPALSAGLRKVTAVKNVGLRNVSLIGSTSQGRPGGYEVGYLARYVDGFRSIDCAVNLCSDKHGWLDSTVNYKIDKQYMFGKADNSTYDGHYGVAVDNCSTWGSVTNCHGRNLYKCITWGASGISSAAASNTYRGIPRWFTGDGNSMWNSGPPQDNAHGLYEFHSPVQHGRLTNSIGADGIEMISLDGGEDLIVEGFMVSHLSRQAIGADGCYRMNGLKVGGGTIGSRSLLASGTRLAGNMTNVATAFDVDNASWIEDLLNDFSPAMVRIGTEKIQVGSRNAANGFTGATRAMFGTTAAAHTTADRVYPLGSYEYVPIDLQLYFCKLLLVDPDKASTTLTGSMTNSQNTVPVADLSLFDAATATQPGYAEIEGENSADGFASEVITYTGKSAATGAGTLTGVVRGQENTNAVTHSANMLVQQYTCALTDIDLHDVDCATDLYRPCVQVWGYNPSRNCRMRNIGMAFTGPESDMPEFCAYVQPHGWNFDGQGSKIRGYNYGYRSQGNRQRMTNIDASVAIQNTTGGYAALIEGDNSTVFGLETDGLYQPLSIASTADKTRYDAVIGRRATAAINNAGTNTSAGAAANV